MATVHVELARVGIRSRALTGSTMPVPDSVEINAVSATSTGSWVEVAGMTASEPNAFWTIVAAGGDVLVRFGADPANASDTRVGRRVPAGAARDFAVTGDAEKCAIKSAP